MGKKIICVQLKEEMKARVFFFCLSKEIKVKKKKIRKVRKSGEKSEQRPHS